MKLRSLDSSKVSDESLNECTQNKSVLHTTRFLHISRAAKHIFLCVGTYVSVDYCNPEYRSNYLCV
jgi:hypothetical protein